MLLPLVIRTIRGALLNTQCYNSVAISYNTRDVVAKWLGVCPQGKRRRFDSCPHLMNAQQYIQKQLEKLKEPSDVSLNANDDLAEFMYSKLTSKKFRKFSIPEENTIRIKKEIQERVLKKEPLLIQYPFGGYKLWRLKEAPEVDWGELFSIMYYARWVKDICKIYEPGVRFIFRFDEVVVKKLNNIPESDTEAYRKSFEELLDFIKPYIPENIYFGVFSERERYDSYEDFEKELAVEIEALREERKNNPFEIPADEKSAIDLNVKLLPDQDKDPNWRDEVNLIHFAYYNLQENKVHPRKHYMHEGIVAFTLMFDATNLIPIGTTKTSVAKFWVGVGALKKRGDSYIETVLSPTQLEQSNCEEESIEIKGLKGKNFSSIRVCV